LTAGELRRKAESTRSASWAARFEALALERERKNAKNARARERRRERREAQARERARKDARNAKDRERRRLKREASREVEGLQLEPLQVETPPEPPEPPGPEVRILIIDEEGHGIGPFVTEILDDKWRNIGIGAESTDIVPEVANGERGRIFAEFLYEAATRAANASDASISEYWRQGDDGRTRKGALAANAEALAALSKGGPIILSVMRLP
jgi:hypothetical protein